MAAIEAAVRRDARTRRGRGSRSCIVGSACSTSRARCFAPTRSARLFALVLMASQAFFYNAIFFTYALVLGRFFAVPAEAIGLYILPFAAGNFLGPLLLGRLFDIVGRKPMIAFTYAASGVLLAATAVLFVEACSGRPARRSPGRWSSSSPRPRRARRISPSARASRSRCARSRSRSSTPSAPRSAASSARGSSACSSAPASGLAIGWGYAFGAALMLIAAAVTLRLGVAAERRSLEDVARPLSAAD